MSRLPAALTAAALALVAAGSASTSAIAAPTPTPPNSPPVTAAPSATIINWAPGSFYTQDISKAPLDPQSDAMSRQLAEQVRVRYNGIAAFNAHHYSTAIYKVDASTRRVDIKFDDCQRKGHTPKGLMDGPAHFRGVPVPENATPSPGTDAELTFYDPAADQLWEFWKFQKNTDGSYQACWGGRIDNVSRSHGQFEAPFGASAAGLAVAAGVITLADIERGEINHAMNIALVDLARWTDFSWPAKRSDGQGTGLIREGQRIRLDPSVDVDALGLTPIATMIAKAAQKYGFVVMDKAGAVSVQPESSDPYGGNPWQARMGGVPAYQIMKGFPWEKTQVIEKDYGKPGTPGGLPDPATPGAPLPPVATPGAPGVPAPGAPTPGTPSVPAPAKPSALQVRFTSCTAFAVDPTGVPGGQSLFIKWDNAYTTVAANRPWTSGEKPAARSVHAEVKDAQNKVIASADAERPKHC